MAGNTYWSPAELAIVDRAARGHLAFDAMVAELPNRTVKAIRKKLSVNPMTVRRPPGTPSALDPDDEGEDDDFEGRWRAAAEISSERFLQRLQASRYGRKYA